MNALASLPVRRLAASKALRVACLSAVGFAAAGCETAKRYLESSEKPTATITSVALKDLDLQGVTLAFDVEVQNPYSVPLPIAALDVALASKGANFLKAESSEQGTAPAKGTKTLPVVAKVGFASLLSVLSGVKPGAVVPYEADLGVSVDAPALGRLRLPLRKEGELPIPTVPRVRVGGVKWGGLSATSATAVVSLEVANDNRFPIDLDALDYGLTLADMKVASAKVAPGSNFGAGASRTLELPISFRPLDFGFAALNALTGSGAKYAFTGSFAARTPFGPLTFPVSAKGDAPLSR
jgi:LEA14-like dessication related protein